MEQHLEHNNIHRTVSELGSGSDAYWTCRFMNPVSQYQKLHISFYTYDGTVIPLEQMLQVRKSLDLQRLTVRVINSLKYTQIHLI